MTDIDAPDPDVPEAYRLFKIHQRTGESIKTAVENGNISAGTAEVLEDINDHLNGKWRSSRPASNRDGQAR